MEPWWRQDGHPLAFIRIDGRRCNGHRGGMGMVDDAHPLPAWAIELVAERAELVAMLRKHEWVEHAASPPWSGVWLECPECEGVKPGSSTGDARGGKEDGHAPDCPRAALLRKHPA